MKYDIDQWDAVSASHALRDRAKTLRKLAIVSQGDSDVVRAARVEMAAYAEQCERVAHILYAKGR